MASCGLTFPSFNFSRTKGGELNIMRTRCILSRLVATLSPKLKWCTVEPQFNEPLFNEVLDITNEILHPG